MVDFAIEVIEMTPDLQGQIKYILAQDKEKTSRLIVSFAKGSGEDMSEKVQLHSKQEAHRHPV